MTDKLAGAQAETRGYAANFDFDSADLIPACHRCGAAEDMPACNHSHCEPCEDCKSQEVPDGPK